MSPTVPPISTSTKSSCSVSATMNLTDGVGDVRDHLHRGAEIFAAPLLGDHRRIDAAGRDVVALAGVDAGEALVVAEVEVGSRRRRR